MRIKLFSLARNRRSNWKENVNHKPNGSKVHENKKYEYDTYNLVWTDPSGKMIKRFVIEDYSGNSNFNSDLMRISSDDKKRLIVVLDQMRNGFVFNDDDKFIRENYFNDGPNVLYHNWDTQTHCLTKRFFYNDSIVYSKTLSTMVDGDGNRLTYDVMKPEQDENGKWFCRVVLSRCYSHYYGNTRYDEKDNTGNDLGSLLDDETVAKLRGASQMVWKRFSRRSIRGLLK